MQPVRLLLAQRYLTALLCVATLLLRLVVPTGFMIGTEHGRMSVEICSGVAGQTMAMDMTGMHGDPADHGKSKDHGKAEMPCAFSGLSAAATQAVDPIQLAALIAFIVAIGLCGTVLPSLSRRIYLRPPLRGPPAFL